MRMIVVFEKGWRLRHIGHLDLMRTMHRALRRTELPVAYSKGFNPHMLTSFASALSVGVAGKREILDVALAESVSEELFKQELSKALPPDLKLKEAIAVTDQHPAFMSLLSAASYRAFFPGSEVMPMVKNVEALIARDEIPAMRKSKSGLKPCDIRPMIYDLKGMIEEKGVTLEMTLALREQATCKPDLVFNALREQAGMAECPPYELVRTALWGEDGQGGLTPLERL